MTLLRNQGGLLPLNAKALKSIAVIGPNATKFVTGGGSGNVTPPATISALQGIRDRAGSGIAVSYDDGSDAARAAKAAAAADVAIVVVGDYQTEGADKSCLTLECPNSGGDQDTLVRRVAGAQRKTVVVLEAGGPVLTPWRNDVGALLSAWYPGDHGGAAIARVLFGDVDPGGRLPVTFPAAASQEQIAGDRAKYPGTIDQDTYYKEGILTGHRWFDAKGYDPAYPFGFGMSYTKVRWGAMSVRRTSTGARIQISVRNVGRRAGYAVPQVYVAVPRTAQVDQPPLKLAAFSKRLLGRRARHRFTLRVPLRAFAHWDVDAKRWAITRGCHGIALGTSSRRIFRRATVAVGGARCRGAVATLPGAVPAAQQ